jgi:GT2 family glycosyltransferase
MILSIIIPTCNDTAYLQRALQSIFTQEHPPLEVIVIDNSSPDSISQSLKVTFPSVTVITNSQNRGTSYARNQGIALAKGKYIMFLDSDVELEKNFFSTFHTVQNKLPHDIAGISPKIIQQSTYRIFSCGLLITSIYRVYDIERDKFSDEVLSPFAIDGPNSCCAILKKESLEQIKEKNYFDEDFFFLFEDADLALRLKNKGKKCICLPQLACFHQGGSSNIPKQKRRYLCFRNRIYMIIKHARKGKLWVLVLKSFAYDCIRTLHFFLSNRYAWLLFKDIYRKWRYEKNNYF